MTAVRFCVAISSLSVFAAVVMILCSKRLTVGHGALHVTLTTIILGTVLLFAWGSDASPVSVLTAAWGAAGAHGVLATAGAYLFWNWGLSRIPSGRAVFSEPRTRRCNAPRGCHPSGAASSIDDAGWSANHWCISACMRTKGRVASHPCRPAAQQTAKRTPEKTKVWTRAQPSR